LALHEVNDVADIIYSAVDKDANILFGSVVEEALGDEIMVTVIATGFKTDALSASPTKSNEFGLFEEPKPETPVVNTEDAAFKPVQASALSESNDYLNRSPDSPYASNQQASRQPYRSYDPPQPTYAQKVQHDASSQDDVDNDIPPFLKPFVTS
jgi:hypothetical protein